MKKFLLAIVAVFSLVPGTVVRAEAPGNTITVEPAVADIELVASETQKRATFTITNTYNVPVELTLELKGIDQEQGAIIPKDNIDDELSASIKLSETLVTIPEQSSYVASMIVLNTDQLAPGGHYATLVITQQKVGTEEVSIKQAVSVGLFIVKRGGQLRDIEPTTVLYNRWPFQLPSSGDITLKNIGNVHVVPRASITVYDANGRLISKGVFNEDSRRVLPGKELSQRVNMNRFLSLWLPQKIKINFEYRADSVEEYRFSETVLWYIPPYSVAVFALLLAAAAWLLRHNKKRQQMQRQVRRTDLEQLGETEMNKTVPKKPKSKKPKRSKKTDNKADSSLEA